MSLFVPARASLGSDQQPPRSSLDAARSRRREYSTFPAHETCKNASAEPLSTRIRPRQAAQTTHRKRVRFEHFNEHLRVRRHPPCLLRVLYRREHEPQAISTHIDRPRDAAREPGHRSDASSDVSTTRGRDQEVAGKLQRLSLPLTWPLQSCIVNLGLKLRLDNLSSDPQYEHNETPIVKSTSHISKTRSIRYYP